MYVSAVEKGLVFSLREGNRATSSLARWTAFVGGSHPRFVPPITTVQAGRPSAEWFDQPPPRHPWFLEPSSAASAKGPSRGARFFAALRMTGNQGPGAYFTSLPVRSATLASPPFAAPSGASSRRRATTASTAASGVEAPALTPTRSRPASHSGRISPAA